MKKAFYLLLSLIVAVSFIVACSAEQSPSATPEQSPTASATPEVTPSATPTPSAASLSDYCIIYPETTIFTGSRYQQLALNLQMTIKNNTKINVEPYEDILDESQGYFEEKYEILIGKTNRDESATVIDNSSLRYLDYVIKYIDGKIVIHADSDEGYQLAFDKFAEIGGEIYEDINGNSIRDLEDVYGIAYALDRPIDAIWSGFDIGVFSKTADGWYELDVNTDKLYTALEKVNNLLHNAIGCITSNVGTTEETMYDFDYLEREFSNGTNLFLVGDMVRAEFEHLRNMQDDYGILPARFRLERIKHHGTVCLLVAYDCISVFLQATDRVHRIVHMLPCHTVFRTEGRLMDLCRRGYGAYSAKPHLVYLERIRGTECRPHIMGTPDIVKHYNYA